MQNQMRLLMCATALLYIGPLMAGLGGDGWAVVPVYLLLFLLWLFILRPQHWPRSFAEWRQPAAWAAALTQAAVQLLLVALLFGVGRGIGGALGFQPPYGPLLPISISFLSIPLSRLIWDPWKSAELNDLLDHAIQHIAPQQTAGDSAALDLARAMVAPLADLPDSTSTDQVARHLAALSAHANPKHICAALFERARSAHVRRAETLALILHTTDARLIADVPGDGPTLALSLLPDAPELIAVFARRLTAALNQNPDLWGKCPSVDHLADLVARYDNTDAEAPLRDLITATNRAQPADGLA